MMEGKMEGTVAAHGNAGDRAIGAALTDLIAAFDEGEKFLQEKILVTDFAVAGVDVETGAAGGSGDEEILEAAFFAEIFDEVPSAGVNKGLLVIAEAVEEIENGEAARFVGIKAGRQKNAVRNGAGEDFAGEGVALDAARSGRSTRNVKKCEEVKETEKADPSTAGR